MYNLLLNPQISVLGAVSWLDLGGLLATISLIIYVYRFARSRVTKEDMEEALQNKANKKMVMAELKLRDEKLKRVEDMSNLQDKYIKERFEEQHAILDTIQADIKKLISKIK